MELVAELVTVAVLTAIVLAWADRSKLDLGLHRRPALIAAWPWAALYAAWIAAEWHLLGVYPVDVDPEFLEWIEQLSLIEEIALTVLVWPLFEELLLRGAMFSALLRRWGLWAAVVVPSLIWGLMHLQYEGWLLASIAGTGVVLAMARWKSGSLYVPLALHAGSNFVDLLAARGLFGEAAAAAGY